MLAERTELTHAAAVLPRLVWDAARLVPLAADDAEAHELLLGYAQSFALLADQAVEVEQPEEAVESAVGNDLAPAPPARPALPEGLLLRALLDEARLELAAPTTAELSTRGVERAMSEHELTGRPVPWRKAHPDAHAELKRTWGVIGHSSVLMLLSLSLIGTSLTLGYLHLPGWLENSACLGTSGAAVGCGAVGLWRLVRALFRSVRAVIHTRRRSVGSKTQGGAAEETQPDAASAEGPNGKGGTVFRFESFAVGFIIGAVAWCVAKPGGSGSGPAGGYRVCRLARRPPVHARGERTRSQAPRAW
ncbi:hypothetical protein ACFWOT_18235 [Streptomyces sp. NPDC058440]|uniref:hypothetical protein n=1 Tax=Streptomyces sp. NPDC058440 TaxID=3346501 RepID=UPI0036469F46